jgi:hypothetical protein
LEIPQPLHAFFLSEKDKMKRVSSPGKKQKMMQNFFNRRMSYYKLGGENSIEMDSKEE